MNKRPFLVAVLLAMPQFLPAADMTPEKNTELLMRGAEIVYEVETPWKIDFSVRRQAATEQPSEIHDDQRVSADFVNRSLASVNGKTTVEKGEKLVVKKVKSAFGKVFAYAIVLEFYDKDNKLIPNHPIEGMVVISNKLTKNIEYLVVGGSGAKFLPNIDLKFEGGSIVPNPTNFIKTRHDPEIYR